jgi:hypothetical protein
VKKRSAQVRNAELLPSLFSRFFGVVVLFGNGLHGIAVFRHRKFGDWLG